MQIRFKNIALSLHFAVVSSFVRKRSMNTYTKCDAPLSRPARHSLAPLQKSRRKSPFLCENRSPIPYGFVPARKLFSIDNRGTQQRFPPKYIQNTF